MKAGKAARARWREEKRKKKEEKEAQFQAELEKARKVAEDAINAVAQLDIVASRLKEDADTSSSESEGAHTLSFADEIESIATKRPCGRERGRLARAQIEDALRVDREIAQDDGESPEEECCQDAARGCELERARMRAEKERAFL